MIEFVTSYITETGRRQRNEDACGYWCSPRGCCWVVSDGAGGHGSGDKASKLVVSAVLENFSAAPVVDEDHVISLLEAAHAAVMNEKRANPQGDDMHATVAIVLIDPQTQAAVWGHVGDSRVYLFRQRVLAHQTRDHSLVQGMIDAGYGDSEMIRSHPQRSLLTSAIGNSGELALSVSGSPVVIQEGDAFLMCTDGWWEYVDEKMMESMLQNVESAEEWLTAMAAQVRQCENDKSDNYTAIGIQAGDLEPVITVILEK
jgi:serine/threonine protein phosphatase PrpC